MMSGGTKVMVIMNLHTKNSARIRMWRKIPTDKKMDF
jgi:hypothetical protein